MSKIFADINSVGDTYVTVTLSGSGAHDLTEPQIEAALSTDAEPSGYFVSGGGSTDEPTFFYPYEKQEDYWHARRFTVVPVYKAPNQPSIPVKPWTKKDSEREIGAFEQWFEEKGYANYPESYPQDTKDAMHKAWQEAAKRASIYADQNITAPEGWQLVPKVLTPDMATELNLTGTFADAAMQVRYAAALAKAPASPTSKQGD